MNVVVQLSSDRGTIFSPRKSIDAEFQMFKYDTMYDSARSRKRREDVSQTTSSQYHLTHLPLRIKVVIPRGLQVSVIIA